MTTTADRLRSVEPLSAVLTADYLEHYGVLPIELAEGRVRVATWRFEIDPQVLDDLSVHFEREVELVRVPEAEVRATIRRVYGDRGLSASDFVDDLGAITRDQVTPDVPLEELLEHVNEPSVVKLANLLLVEALDSRASDIHIEVFTDALRVRYRVDGVLQEAPAPPVHLMPGVICRLKHLAGLSVTERHAPQEGRIGLNVGDRRIGVRVSAIPTLHGESLVLRLLARRTGSIRFQDLGLAPDVEARFKEIIERPQGIILIAGPAGSGTTTTSYTVLDYIRSGRDKILTIEDTIEYELAGVPQIPVSEQAGTTYVMALQAALGQDPDVVFVGETRDSETADLVTRAAQVGRLVFSVVHASDAVRAITLLLDLGVPGYQVANTLHGVLAQRLVRTVCSYCVEERPTGSGIEAAFGPEAGAVKQIRVGRGCDQCRGTGYLGRTGVFELLVVDDKVRSLIQRGRGAGEIRKAATALGMKSLIQDGLRRIMEGVTTPDEVLRVVRL